MAKDKTNIKNKDKNTLINRGLSAIVIILFLILSYQFYETSQIYKKKSAGAVGSGSKVIINAKDNFVQSLEISSEELTKLSGKDIPKEIEAEEVKKVEESAEEKISYDKANLSIIITEVGQTKEGLQLAETLPKEVSFALSPYSDNLQSKIDSGLKQGRQIMLNLMFEPSGFPAVDTGPYTILTSSEAIKNVLKFENSIQNIKGYSGFFTNYKELVTRNLEVITPVLNKIKDQDKFFGYYRNESNANLENDAKPMAVDIVMVDYLIDEIPDAKFIKDKLKLVKQDLITKKKKIVIAIRPYKISVEVLKTWLDKNLGKNIQIAPVSYFVINN